MDANQRFLLEKIMYGLANKGTPEPMTSEDLERLNLREDEYYKKIPTSERNEWSMKIHNAMQVAFMDDTSKYRDKEKISEWSKHFIELMIRGLTISKREFIVLDTTALHFVKEDLAHHLYRDYGYKNLTGPEQALVDLFSGAAKFADKEAIVDALSGATKYKGKKGWLGVILFALIITLVLVEIFLLYIK